MESSASFHIDEDTDDEELSSISSRLFRSSTSSTFSLGSSEASGPLDPAEHHPEEHVADGVEPPRALAVTNLITDHSSPVMTVHGETLVVGSQRESRVSTPVAIALQRKRSVTFFSPAAVAIAPESNEALHSPRAIIDTTLMESLSAVQHSGGSAEEFVAVSMGPTSTSASPVLSQRNLGLRIPSFSSIAPPASDRNSVSGASGDDDTAPLPLTGQEEFGAAVVVLTRSPNSSAEVRSDVVSSCSTRNSPQFLQLAGELSPKQYNQQFYCGAAQAELDSITVLPEALLEGAREGLLTITDPSLLQQDSTTASILGVSFESPKRNGTVSSGKVRNEDVNISRFASALASYSSDRRTVTFSFRRPTAQAADERALQQQQQQQLIVVDEDASRYLVMLAEVDAAEQAYRQSGEDCERASRLIFFDEYLRRHVSITLAGDESINRANIAHGEADAFTEIALFFAESQQRCELNTFEAVDNDFIVRTLVASVEEIRARGELLQEYDGEVEELFHHWMVKATPQPSGAWQYQTLVDAAIASVLSCTEQESLECFMHVYNFYVGLHEMSVVRAMKEVRHSSLAGSTLLQEGKERISIIEEADRFWMNLTADRICVEEMHTIAEDENRHRMFVEEWYNLDIQEISYRQELEVAQYADVVCCAVSVEREAALKRNILLEAARHWRDVSEQELCERQSLYHDILLGLHADEAVALRGHLSKSHQLFEDEAAMRTSLSDESWSATSMLWQTHSEKLMDVWCRNLLETHQPLLDALADLITVAAEEDAARNWLHRFMCHSGATREALIVDEAVERFCIQNEEDLWSQKLLEPGRLVAVQLDEQLVLRWTVSALSWKLLIVQQEAASRDEMLLHLFIGLDAIQRRKLEAEHDALVHQMLVMDRDEPLERRGMLAAAESRDRCTLESMFRVCCRVIPAEASCRATLSREALSFQLPKLRMLAKTSLDLFAEEEASRAHLLRDWSLITITLHETFCRRCIFLQSVRLRAHVEQAYRTCLFYLRNVLPFWLRASSTQRDGEEVVKFGFSSEGRTRKTMMLRSATIIAQRLCDWGTCFSGEWHAATPAERHEQLLQRYRSLRRRSPASLRSVKSSSRDNAREVDLWRRLEAVERESQLQQRNTAAIQSECRVSVLQHQQRSKAGAVSKLLPLTHGKSILGVCKPSPPPLSILHRFRRLSSQWFNYQWPKSTNPSEQKAIRNRTKKVNTDFLCTLWRWRRAEATWNARVMHSYGSHHSRHDPSPAVMFVCNPSTHALRTHLMTYRMMKRREALHSRRSHDDSRVALLAVETMSSLSRDDGSSLETLSPARFSAERSVAADGGSCVSIVRLVRSTRKPILCIQAFSRAWLSSLTVTVRKVHDQGRLVAAIRSIRGYDCYREYSDELEREVGRILSVEERTNQNVSHKATRGSDGGPSQLKSTSNHSRPSSAGHRRLGLSTATTTGAGRLGISPPLSVDGIYATSVYFNRDDHIRPDVRRPFSAGKVRDRGPASTSHHISNHTSTSLGPRQNVDVNGKLWSESIDDAVDDWVERKRKSIMKSRLR